ncbi:hypothetical protein SARC_14115, partial [Sphaeroforma arctica JP610]
MLRPDGNPNSSPSKPKSGGNAEKARQSKARKHALQMQEREKKRKRIAERTEAEATPVETITKTGIGLYLEPCVCRYCGEDLTNSVHIRCVECTDVPICMKCFASGREPATHKRTHSYRVIDVAFIAPFQESWSADQDLALLNAIDKNGVADWGSVAKEVRAKV